MRLLVVGGRLQGVEAVYLARKAGFGVRLVDKASVVPAMALADEFVQADVTRPRQLARVAEGMDLILPALENRAALEALAENAPHLGTPLAFDRAAYAISSSKKASDHLFARQHIPAPVPWPKCGYPAVVKPSEGSGSEGVRVLVDDHTRRRHYGDHFPPEAMVVQQYLEGPAYSVEVIGKPGSYCILPATALEMDADHDCKRVRMAGGLTLDETDRLAAIGRSCAEALCLTGIMDVEVIQHAGDFKVLEIDARLPSQTPITVFHGSGVNQVELLAHLFRGAWERAAQTPAAIQREVIFEHIRVTGKRLQVRGEHIMAVRQPLRLIHGFFGADEALTTYADGADTWVATLIITAADRSSVWVKRGKIMDRLRKTLGLWPPEDPVAETPRGLGGDT